ncbi:MULTISPECIES: hypothetical protein [unclassified Pseudomonas]|uniref:hypothetical protein n=1 Tax=unclassified Pseudomonas TaxID=196821 RepID=UPI00111BF317|nr:MULTISPECIES: hypothetical protein [unclassified Pseudomonas]
MEQYIEYIIYGVSPEKDWTDYAATVIALAAVCFTIYQVMQQRRHNRLMVTPNLDGVTHEDVQQNSYVYTITNNGVGPAILKSVELYFDDVLMAPEKLISDMVVEIFPSLPRGNFGHHVVAVGSFIPVGAVIKIVTISCMGDLTPDEVKKTLSKRTRLVLQYESIYKDVFYFDSSVD